MTDCKTILVAVDYSPCSVKAARKGLALAKQFNANLYLLNIVEPLPAIAYGYTGSRDIEDDIYEHAKENLAELADELGIDGENCLIELGQPKLDIIEVAKKLKADLMILGKHGHHSHHLLGSTTSSITNHASCDVLVVHEG